MIRDIRITAVANGFIVNVGCQSIVFTGHSPKACSSELCFELDRYLTDPEGTEARWRKDKCFNLKHTLNEPGPCDPVQLMSAQWRPENCNPVPPSQCCDRDVPS